MGLPNGSRSKRKCTQVVVCNLSDKDRANKAAMEYIVSDALFSFTGVKLTLDEAGAANSIRDRSTVQRYVKRMEKNGRAEALRKQCVENHVQQHGKKKCAPCTPPKPDANLFRKAVKMAGKRMANSDQHEPRWCSV